MITRTYENEFFSIYEPLVANCINWVIDELKNGYCPWDDRPHFRDECRSLFARLEGKDIDYWLDEVKYNILGMPESGRETYLCSILRHFYDFPSNLCQSEEGQQEEQTEMQTLLNDLLLCKEHGVLRGFDTECREMWENVFCITTELAAGLDKTLQECGTDLKRIEKLSGITLPERKRPEPQPVEVTTTATPADQVAQRTTGGADEAPEARKVEKRGQPSKDIYEFLLGDDEEKQKTLSILHKHIDGRTGKNAYQILAAAVKAKFIMMPTYPAAKEEFGEGVVKSSSNYNKFLTQTGYNSFSDIELEQIIEILKDEAQK